jgi:hypothetical protein
MSYEEEDTCHIQCLVCLTSVDRIEHFSRGSTLVSRR